MKKFSSEIHIALLMGEGNAQARMAHGEKDAIRASLALLNQGEKSLPITILKIRKETKIRFASSIDVAKRQLQISKASALLAAGCPVKPYRS